jgi:hypothetical protein
LIRQSAGGPLDEAPWTAATSAVSGKRGGSGDGLLILLGLLIGIAFWGPVFAAQLSLSMQQMFTILAPIVGPVLGITLIILIVRAYWSRY